VIIRDLTTPQALNCIDLLVDLMPWNREQS